jgi:hypothetical protein
VRRTRTYYLLSFVHHTVNESLDSSGAIACAALERPLPPATCGGAVAESAGVAVVHVHRGPHPEAPRDSAPQTLPPNALQREEMRPHFTAPNRSLGVEWLRPGL